MAAHSGAASGNFWESFATNSTAASSSAPQFPSFDDWLIQFSSGFLANLTQLDREAIPPDIASAAEPASAFAIGVGGLVVLFITGKDQVFSDFFKVQGRYALSTLVNTANKHLFATALGPAAFVRLSVVVRDVLQTVQQRVRRGLSGHFNVDVSALVGLDFFASSFLDDAKGNYESNERFLTGGSLFRQINCADVSSAILAHAGGGARIPAEVLPSHPALYEQRDGESLPAPPPSHLTTAPASIS